MPTLADLRLPETSARLEREVLDEVRDRTLQTCQRIGIIRDDRMPLKKYLAGRFELLAALAYPDADIDELVLCNDFNVSLFYIDDQADEDERYGKRPEHLEEYFEVHVRALRDGAAVSEQYPAGLLLLDLRERLLQRASPEWLTRFAHEFGDYLHRGALTAAKHWSNGTVPTVADYRLHRVWDSAVICIQNLIEVAGAGELPRAVHECADFQRLRSLAATVVSFTNDLASYAKEVRHNPTPNNLVHVVMTHEHRSLDSAIDRVIDIINDDADSFERIAARLPSFDPSTQAKLRRYLRGQRGWMGGNLLWSLASGRYTDSRSPFPELRASGDAAYRLRSMVAERPHYR
jgi:hypothetical protein